MVPPGLCLRLLYLRQPGPLALGPLALFSSSAPPLFSPLCCVDPPRVFQSPGPPWQVDPLAMPWATKPPITPPRPVDHLAPPWLLAPLASPGAVVLTAPLGSLVPLAVPWSAFALPTPQTSGPLAAHRPSTPSTPSGYDFPATPQS